MPFLNFNFTKSVQDKDNYKRVSIPSAGSNKNVSQRTRQTDTQRIESSGLVSSRES